MKILFVHQNFPGQYLRLAQHLAQQPGNEIVFITQRTDATLPGVKKLVYKAQRTATQGVHHYLREMESAVLNGQEVARTAMALKTSGFVPDLMIGHNGWGEIWYLKDVFPTAKLLGYFEFFYRYADADVGFDPKQPPSFDDAPRIRTKNLGNLLGLDAVDWGQTPTQWQRSVYPLRYQPIISVIHEGIDTDAVAPDAKATVTLARDSLELRAGEEIVTYVARNLEPYRGFPTFMRSLPEIMRKRPKARFLIVGGDETSYGPPAPPGQPFRKQMLDELGSELDMKRIHFLGKVPYSQFLKILQVSRVHVYLTFPFVLSWSMLEAMSAGCLLVASDTPPVAEVIRDGRNGLLVDFFDPANVAARVVEALEDASRFQDLRQAARRTIIERYDLARVCLPGQIALIERMMR